MIELETKPITYQVVETWEGFLQGLKDIHNYLDLSKAKGDKERLAYDIETYMDLLTRAAVDAIFYSKKRKKTKAVEVAETIEISEDDEEETEEAPPEDEDLPEYPVPYPVKNKEGRYDARVRLLQFGFNPKLVDAQIIFDLDKILASYYGEVYDYALQSEERYMKFYAMVGTYLQPIFDRATIIGQNLKYEYAFSWKYFRCRMHTMRDLMLMAQVRYMGDKSKKHSLGELYALNILEDIFYQETGKTHDEYKKFKKAEQKSPWYNLELTPNQLKYAAEDVRLVWLVFETLLVELTAWANTSADSGIFGTVVMECELIKSIAKAEIRGIQVDTDYYWNELKPWILGKMEECQSAINALCMKEVFKKCSSGTKKDKVIWVEKIQVPYNPNSDHQVREILGRELCSKLPRTDKGAASVAADNLMFIRDDHPAVPHILNFKKLKKLISFFESKLGGYITLGDADGKLHGSIHQIGQSDLTVDSGRMSMTRPNLTQVPAQGKVCEVAKKKLIRKAFIAPPGKKLIVLDLSQIEPRLTAQDTLDPFLISCFRDGRDMHSETAKTVFLLDHLPLKGTPDEHYRDKGKIMRLARTYQMGIDKFMRELYVDTEGEIDYCLRGEQGKREAMAVIDMLENLSPAVITRRAEIEEDVKELPCAYKTLKDFKNGTPFYVSKTMPIIKKGIPPVTRTRSFCLNPDEKNNAAKDPDNWHMSKKVMYERTGNISTWDNMFNRKIRNASREAWNNRIQSSAANLFKLCIIEVNKKMEALHDQGVMDEYEEGMILFIHDEIVSESTDANAPMVLELVKSTMQEVGEWFINEVPVVVEGGIGQDWLEAK